MKSPLLLTLLLLMGVSVLYAKCLGAETPTKPNIVVILSDDYGWGSASCYGGVVPTPNLDRLAREGRRFTNAYAPGSVCSPTRYALMTGRYFWRTDIKDGSVLPGNAPLHIEPTRTTLASLCKSAGYQTAAFGKWHLGLGSEITKEWSKPLTPGPLTIGFDHFYGLAANPWNGPHAFIENENVLDKIEGQPVTITGNREKATTTGILKQFEVDNIMQTLTGKVGEWIDQNHTKPFFVYYAPTAVHEPIAPNAKFTGSPQGKYGDFIQELDWSVGQVLEALDRHRLAENTLIIFSSDNGGVVNPQNESATTAMNAGLKINGPLRGGKHSEWEGGFREPFLVRWPGQVPAGTTSDQVLCLTDVLATLAEVLQIPLTKGNAEDSLSALRAFTEKEAGAPVRDHVILQSAEAVYAIRSGDWKLIERVDAPAFEQRNRQKAALAAKKRKNAPKQNELYNLKEDVAEEKDAYSGRSDVATKLKTTLNDVRQRGYTRADAGGQ